MNAQPVAHTPEAQAKALQDNTGAWRSLPRSEPETRRRDPSQGGGFSVRGPDKTGLRPHGWACSPACVLREGPDAVSLKFGPRRLVRELIRTGRRGMSLPPTYSLRRPEQAFGEGGYRGVYCGLATFEAAKNCGL